MASLLSSLEISGITGIFEDIFDTFKRTIVIHKEPVKTISQINTEKILRNGPISVNIKTSKKILRLNWWKRIAHDLLIEAKLTQLIQTWS